jgi:putative membrane protein
MMVKDHKKDIDLFEREANNGEDADLKSWASGKLPTLKHHLEMAEKMQSAL